MLTAIERALFWMQSPLTIAAGFCIFFSIPRTFSASTSTFDKQTLRQKLARVDYLGAILLVSPISHFPCPVSSVLILLDFLPYTPPYQLILTTHIPPPNLPVLCCPHSLHPD